MSEPETFTLGSEQGRPPKVPFSHAVLMAAQSMRNRFGRNLITLAGVALGIAFLMSVLTGNAIDGRMKEYREYRNKVQGKVARIATVAGRLRKRTIAILGPIQPETHSADSRSSSLSP